MHLPLVAIAINGSLATSQTLLPKRFPKERQYHISGEV